MSDNLLREQSDMRSPPSPLNMSTPRKTVQFDMARQTNQNLYGPNKMTANDSINRQRVLDLKSNTELVFRSARLFSQVAFYPLKTLRWKCQINSESSRYHLTPFTLIPVIYNLNFNGIVGWWRGIYSFAACEGFKLVYESTMDQLFTVKTIDTVDSLENLKNHLLVKFSSCALSTAIYAVAVYESVQSTVARENFGVLDLFREVRNRVVGLRSNYRTRLIPIWTLVLPTSCYFVAFHLVSYSFECIVSRVIFKVNEILKDNRRCHYEDEIETETVVGPYLESLTHLISQFGTIFLLYPIETVLNRLIVQGTRTIIDNTDSGYNVVPINTRYEGFFDSVRSIHLSEGSFGFYKGVGAVLLEASLTFALLKFAEVVAYRLYESEWVTPSDQDKARNYLAYSSSAATMSANQQRIYEQQQQQQLHEQHNKYSKDSNY